MSEFYFVEEPWAPNIRVTLSDVPEGVVCVGVVGADPFAGVYTRVGSEAAYVTGSLEPNADVRYRASQVTVLHRCDGVPLPSAPKLPASMLEAPEGRVFQCGKARRFRCGEVIYYCWPEDHMWRSGGSEEPDITGAYNLVARPYSTPLISDDYLYRSIK